MKVTQVRRKGNNVFVVFDLDEQVIIPYELFVHNYLAKDDELSNNQINKLLEKIEIYKIKQSSFRYLSGRNHCRYELKLKLLKKKYSKFHIENVLDDLEKKQLLSDKNFAKDFFLQQQKKKKGLLKIKSALMQKGVNSEIIEETVLELSDNQIFLEQAEKLIEKKLKEIQKKDLTEIQRKQKLYQFLATRGFTSDIIREVLNKLKL